MNLFQWLTISVLAAVLLAESIGLARKSTGRGLRLIRISIWAAAAAAIGDPEFPQAVATYVGIARGADFVLYVGLLASLATFFYFYSRYLRLQGQLADVVRHLAIQNARRGGEEDLDGSPIP
jgi:small membrane protein